MRRALALPLLLALASCSSGSSSSPTAAPTASPTPAISGLMTYSDLSHLHLSKGQYGITYPQSPPVGGAHSQVWLKCQVYDVELPKVNAVHSLEHGGIWITYQPALDKAQVMTLQQKVILNNEFVMVSPYAGQDSPVVVTGWGLQIKAASASDPRIDQFIRTYAGGNQGGEKGVGCASTGATLQQALAYDATQK